MVVLVAVLLLGWILLFASLAVLPLWLPAAAPAVCRVAVEADGRGSAPATRPPRVPADRAPIA
jgi:hypothetical protein